MNQTVLVTGGAGYIGSHTTRQLLAAGHRVVVLDNFYSGHRWAVASEATLVEGDAGDGDLICELVRTHQISACMHFAGFVIVPESMRAPAKYYQNNALASFKLIQACRRVGVQHFIFSSSAAVYGIPATVPVTERAHTVPINPYGFTKLVTEWMLSDLSTSDLINEIVVDQRFNYVALRYFNVAGAAPDGSTGQATPNATHLIKVACEAACGKRDSVRIFGTDYDTEDGTCIRDYIHVEDLARAHVIALEYLLAEGESVVLNCGYGRGFSVREVLNTVQRVSNRELNIIDAPRRVGDPPALIADNREIRKRFDWRPLHDDLEFICSTAYQWETKLDELHQLRANRG